VSFLSLFINKSDVITFFILYFLELQTTHYYIRQLNSIYVSNVDQKTALLLIKSNPLVRPTLLYRLTHLLRLLLPLIYFILKFDDHSYEFHPSPHYSTPHDTLQFFYNFNLGESFPSSDLGIVEYEGESRVVRHLIVTEGRVKHHLMLGLLPKPRFRD
jgi:hypothetical protein